MEKRLIWFTGPRQLTWQTRPLAAPRRGEMRVRTRFTAISPGTELLIWRGDLPRGLSADAAISALEGELAYPLTYGYAAVGEVVEIGPETPSDWLGRRVFSFQPHSDGFCAPLEAVIPIPEGISWQEALFLPNMETAVNLVMDGRPLLGERVLVLGQGVVGLLTAGLLARFPLSELVTVDRWPRRLALSRQLGAGRALQPQALDAATFPGDGADLTYELTGQPAVLNTALAFTGFAGRVVIGSWYGSKQASLDLGGRFHRSRIQIISSQVSTIAPELRGRWDKARRFDLAWRMIAALRPARLVTHVLPADRAAEAYRLLDEQPDEAVQVLLQWKD